MLGRSLRLLSLSIFALTMSAVGCADLIGLSGLDSDSGSVGSGGSGADEDNDLGGDTSSGGSAAPAGGAASGGSPSGGAASGGAASGGADGDGGDPASGGSAGEGGAGPDCFGDDFTDEFNDASLTAACWDTFNRSRLWNSEYSIDEEQGVLVLRPNAGPAWFEGDSAFFLYREIGGNFLMEVELSVYGGSSASVPEQQPFVQFANGGLLAFPSTQPLTDITGSFSDYYAIKTGSLGSDFHLGFRGEFTVEDMTTLATVETPQALSGMSLRMCRYGNILWTAFRIAGESNWQPLHANGEEAGYDSTHPDLPDLEDAMYVGLLGEIRDPDAAHASARMIYSRAQFSVPNLFDDCKN